MSKRNSLEMKRQRRVLRRIHEKEVPSPDKQQIFTPFKDKYGHLRYAPVMVPGYLGRKSA